MIIECNFCSVINLGVIIVFVGNDVIDFSC
jgi:hypothetical protein